MKHILVIDDNQNVRKFLREPSCFELILVLAVLADGLSVIKQWTAAAIQPGKPEGFHVTDHAQQMMGWHRNAGELDEGCIRGLALGFKPRNVLCIDAEAPIAGIRAQQYSGLGLGNQLLDFVCNRAFRIGGLGNGLQHKHRGLGIGCIG